jgi:putative membrane protein
MLSPADHQRVHDALAKAEQATSGEIYCVVALESGKYRETPLAWAAALALVGPPLALALGLRSGAFVSILLLVVQSGWSVEQAGAAEAMTTSALIGYAALQAALFALVVGLGLIPGVRRFMTPSALKRERVHARATEQFAHRTHASTAPAGIMIYASIAERRVEVVADEAIHAKVADGEWDRAVKAALGPIRAGDVAAGLIAAIELCGRTLAEHFPPGGAGPLQDAEEHLLEL